MKKKDKKIPMKELRKATDKLADVYNWLGSDKDGEEQITLIDIEEKETEINANISMLVAHARMNGKILFRIGACKCLLKVLDDDLIDEIDK